MLDGGGWRLYFLRMLADSLDGPSDSSSSVDGDNVVVPVRLVVPPPPPPPAEVADETMDQSVVVDV